MGLFLRYAWDMSHHHADLLAAIDRFIEAAEISEITFGRKALGDPHFVKQLRHGRRLWPETEAKVRAFMQPDPEVSATADAPAASQSAA